MLSFGLSAAMAATDVVVQNKINGSGITALIISNEEMEDIMKIVKSLEESGLLIKGINKAIKNEVKDKRDGFLPMLLGTLAASKLGTTLTGKVVIRVGKDILRAGQNFNILHLDAYKSIGTRWIGLYVCAENVTYF